MKKINISIFLISMLFISGCNNNINISDNFKIEAKETKKCDLTKSKKYYKIVEQQIYLACLDEIKLVDDKTSIHLKEYLENDKKGLEKILTKLNKEANAIDGGSKIYRSKEESVNKITLVTCNTLDGNKDIYIGPYDLDLSASFENGFCK